MTDHTFYLCAQKKYRKLKNGGFKIFMQITLHFKDATLGVLKEDFSFQRNLKGEERFKKYVNSKIYPFFQSTDKKVVKSFFENNFLTQIKKRADILKKANIQSTDDDFTTLFKFACLSQATMGYHLEATK